MASGLAILSMWLCGAMETCPANGEVLEVHESRTCQCPPELLLGLEGDWNRQAGILVCSLEGSTWVCETARGGTAALQRWADWRQNPGILIGTAFQ